MYSILGTLRPTPIYLEYVWNILVGLFDNEVHATDFDDNFAGERVANFLANGRAMGGDCYPLVNGYLDLSLDVWLAGSVTRCGPDV